MSQPISFFTTIYPDRRDPNREGVHYLCRFCGKSTEHTRKQFYCSDECYWLCQKSLAWWEARRLVYERDEGKCVKCGMFLGLDAARNRDSDKPVCNIHHVFPVKEIILLTYDVINEWKEKGWLLDKDRNRGWCIIYALLYLDINNLITLCPTCHKKIHGKKELVLPVTLNYFFNHDTYE